MSILDFVKPPVLANEMDTGRTSCKKSSHGSSCIICNSNTCYPVKSGKLKCLTCGHEQDNCRREAQV